MEGERRPGRTRPGGRLTGLLRKMRSAFRRSGQDEVFDVGFHGDRYLIRAAEHSLTRSRAFVETGCNVGSTLGWVARNHPDISCFSCEPDTEACGRARRTVEAFDNVELFPEPSLPFLERLLRRGIHRMESTFWLDAHGGEHGWPLPEELRIVSGRWGTARVFVDDCRVPGRPWFRFDRYEGVDCSPELILDSLDPSAGWRLWLPTYRERTSRHHPLRGWALLELAGPEGFRPVGPSPEGESWLELHAASSPL